MGKLFHYTRKAYDFFRKVSSLVFGSHCSSRILLIDENRILVVDQGSYLELPGGAVKPGESFEDAARRETMEETSIDIKLGKRIQEKSFGSVLEVMFRARASGDRKPQGSWEGEARWLDINKATGRDWRFDRDIDRLLEK
jgi:8-oxo-dGTP pyrophosphatase MutT (NUDIX family)